MGVNTLLYVQTSQCHMHTSGQFDTLYHEHLSFFTAHSFSMAATLSNLWVVNFEIVPIHGNSCLWTLRRNLVGAPVAAAVQAQLEHEAAAGIGAKRVAVP